jgi:hypothetical protein
MVMPRSLFPPDGGPSEDWPPDYMQPPRVADRNRTRLAGHALQHEGKPFEDGGEVNWSRTYGAAGRGVCECGEASTVLASDADRKRWHKGHKDEVRRA